MKALAVNIASLGKLIAGLQKHQPNVVLLINGKSYTTAEIVQTLQSIIDSLNAAVAARATFLEASRTVASTVSNNRPFVSGVTQSVHIAYGDSASVLSDFGLVPRKLTVLTPQQKAAAALKAKATRLARHTMGKKQKLAITGTTPATAPAASAPAVPAAPATTSTPQGGAVVPGSSTSTGH